VGVSAWFSVHSLTLAATKYGWQQHQADKLPAPSHFRKFDEAAANSAIAMNGDARGHKKTSNAESIT
jgi:hypothetical protein